MVGFEGTPKLGPYWKLQPATYKITLDWKEEIESVNEDKSHSWVRISHGLNKLVTDLNNKEQETSEMQFEEFVENECTCFCEPIKGQSKTTKTYFCLLIYKNCTYRGKKVD